MFKKIAPDLLEMGTATVEFFAHTPLTSIRLSLLTACHIRIWSLSPYGTLWNQWFLGKQNVLVVKWFLVTCTLRYPHMSSCTCLYANTAIHRLCHHHLLMWWRMAGFLHFLVPCWLQHLWHFAFTGMPHNELCPVTVFTGIQMANSRLRLLVPSWPPPLYCYHAKTSHQA